MILFPPAKINLGLNILRKRDDGYHDIESVMVQIPLCDILEITKAETFEFVQTGKNIVSEAGTNLCEKAFQLFQDHFDISNVRIHLRKQIPIGAGLGGGSADATYTLIALNKLFQLKLSSEELKKFAAQLGSDCPFFVDGTPQIATGRGDLLSPIELDLSNVYLVLLNPGIHVGTKEAYAGVHIDESAGSIRSILQTPIEKWHENLLNGFEPSVFPKHPEIQSLKESLYESGAIYAAMSGSGSSVFGLFSNEIFLQKFDSPHLIYKGKFKNMD
ncbi:MAG: 4-(cytidine 5'-diphospho)-2-C-methyl-D-erythritol kinase [Crocinitomicaceae bacterium]